MASFSDRISVLIDVTTDKATTALSHFRKAVGEADGAVQADRVGRLRDVVPVRAGRAAR